MNTLQSNHPTLAMPAASVVANRRGVAPVSQTLSLSDVMRLLGGEPDLWSDSCAVRAWCVRKDSTFFHEGSPVNAIYVVRFGSFKSVKYGDDGYEHVLGFIGAGEIMGFEGLAIDHQPRTVTALQDSGLIALPLDELDQWRRQSAALDHCIQRALSVQLVRAGDTADMMSAVAAEVRLARFVVWHSGRMAARGLSPRRFLLPMQRRDIASLLGVAKETISRGFSMLSDWGYINVDKREIEILDMDGLKGCTRSTRRDMEKSAWRHGVANGSNGTAASVEHATLGPDHLHAPAIPTFARVQTAPTRVLQAH